MADSISALAIVLEGDPAARLGPYPDLVDSLILPVQIFKTEEEALDWLHRNGADAPPLEGEVRRSSVDTATVSIYLDTDGFVVAREKRAGRHDGERTHRALDALAEVGGGARPAMLWDVRNLVTSTAEAQAIFVQRIEKLVSAIAVLAEQSTDPGFVATLDNYGPIINALMVPLVVFTEEEAARDWLRSRLSTGRMSQQKPAVGLDYCLDQIVFAPQHCPGVSAIDPPELRSRPMVVKCFEGPPGYVAVLLRVGENRKFGVSGSRKSQDRCKSERGGEFLPNSGSAQGVPGDRFMEQAFDPDRSGRERGSQGCRRYRETYGGADQGGDVAPHRVAGDADGMVIPVPRPRQQRPSFQNGRRTHRKEVGDRLDGLTRPGATHAVIGILQQESFDSGGCEHSRQFQARLVTMVVEGRHEHRGARRADQR